MLQLLFFEETIIRRCSENRKAAGKALESAVYLIKITARNFAGTWRLCRFGMDQVNQITDILHTSHFTQFKFDPELRFDLRDELDMAQRIPAFYIIGGHIPSNTYVVFIKNLLEHGLQLAGNFFFYH